MNDYYDVNRKRENIELLKKYNNFNFIQDDIRSMTYINDFKPDKVCHLASMAGVRYSIENPEIYVDVNIKGFYKYIGAM